MVAQLSTSKYGDVTGYVSSVDYGKNIKDNPKSHRGLGKILIHFRDFEDMKNLRGVENTPHMDLAEGNVTLV